MPEEVTLVRILEKLTSDGYDLEIYTNLQSIRVTAITENKRIQASRFIPHGSSPRELALIFWDISSSIKRLERKFNRVD